MIKKDQHFYVILLVFQYLTLKTNEKNQVNITQLTEFLQEELGTDVIKDYRSVSPIIKKIYENKDEFNEMFNVNIERTGSGDKCQYYAKKSLDEDTAAKIINAISHDVFTMPHEAEDIEKLMYQFCDNAYLDSIEEKINRKVVSKYSGDYEIYYNQFQKAKELKMPVNVVYYENNNPTNKIEIKGCYVAEITKIFNEPYIRLIQMDSSEIYEISLFNITEKPKFIDRSKLFRQRGIKLKAFDELMYEKAYDDNKVTITFCLEKNVDKRPLSIRFKENYNMYSSIEYGGQEKLISLVYDKETGKKLKDIKIFDNEYEFFEYKNSLDKSLKILKPIKRTCYEAEFENVDRFVKWVINPDNYYFIRVLSPFKVVSKILFEVASMYKKALDLDMFKE